MTYTVNVIHCYKHLYPNAGGRNTGFVALPVSLLRWGRVLYTRGDPMKPLGVSLCSSFPKMFVTPYKKGGWSTPKREWLPVLTTKGYAVNFWPKRLTRACHLPTFGNASTLNVHQPYLGIQMYVRSFAPVPDAFPKRCGRAAPLSTRRNLKRPSVYSRTWNVCWKYRKQQREVPL